MSLGPISSGGGDINPDLSAKSGTGPFAANGTHGGLSVNNSTPIDTKTLMIAGLVIAGLFVLSRMRGAR